MEKTDDIDQARFAPDYDVAVEPAFVDAALRRLTPDEWSLLHSCDEEGEIPDHAERLHVRDLVLHGLAEIFVPRLTPLGMAVRDRIRR